MVAISSQAQSSRSIPPAEGGDRIVKLYPNPAQSYITFDLQKDYKNGLIVQVYSGLLGKKMYESQNVPEKFTLNLTDFTRGVYIYHLVDASGKILESGKFQVSR
jgi:hypothetical protein